MTLKGAASYGSDKVCYWRMINSVNTALEVIEIFIDYNFGGTLKAITGSTLETATNATDMVSGGTYRFPSSSTVWIMSVPYQ